MGLPHTAGEYKETKRILEETYGQEIKVQKRLIKDIECLPTITGLHEVQSIYDFYHKLSRAVRTLTTMEKIDFAQCLVFTLLDKLRSLRGIITQQDNNRGS